MDEGFAFKDMDFLINPKSSLERHKPHTRLNNFHCLDYDEELLIDLSYCDRSIKNLFPSSKVALTFGDSLLIASYHGKTSTPFKEVLLNRNSHVDVPQKQTGGLQSLVEDSGFNDDESFVASSFASSCVITSPREQRRKRSFNGSSYWSHEAPALEDEFSDIPLPCISLESHFDDVNSDDSSDSVHHEKLCQREPTACTTNAELSANGNFGDQSYRERTDSFKSRFDQVLKRFSPKDTQRVIGRKIGLKEVDFIRELAGRSVLPVLNELFNNVTDADLCSMSCVSRCWARAVKTHKKANMRRLRHVNFKRTPKSDKVICRILHHKLSHLMPVYHLVKFRFIMHVMQ